MKKIICNAKDCANKDVVYFMPIEDEKVMCGGCKQIIDANKMSDSEIASTFDYDLNATRGIGRGA
jgi:hypothetical protein